MSKKFNEKDVPKWCNWIAVDKNGECWAFYEKPDFTKRNIWSAAAGQHSAKLLYKDEPPKNWKEELYAWK